MLFNFSFNINIEIITANIGEDILRVVNSGRVIFFKQINVKKGIGRKIIPPLIEAYLSKRLMLDYGVMQLPHFG